MPATRDNQGRATRSRGRWTTTDPVLWLLAYVFAASAIFLVFPAIDLWATDLFYTDRGFRLSRVGFLQSLRQINTVLVVILVTTPIVSVVAKLAMPRRPSLVPANVSLFLITTLLLGPGLLVNGLLKNFWGRPRPVMVDGYGGDLPYTVVWQVTDHCDRNCSFVSGEASTAAWFMAVALVLPRPLRLPVAIATGLLAVILSLNRVAFGRHFLSDVMLSWGLTGLVIVVAHRLMIVDPPVWLRADRLEAALTGVGLRLHGRQGESDS